MIIGAGLTGLIAAHSFPREDVYEANDSSIVNHQALLRFRSPAVSDLVGIPFQRVLVRKGIWDKAGWTAPNISACNRYAIKVAGRIIDRSIWDTSTCERWIAPKNLQEQLVEALEARLHWNMPVDLRCVPQHEMVLSTCPLPLVTKALNIACEPFNYAPIITTTFTVSLAEAYQTIYFPSDCHGLYRASLSGNELTCEWMDVGIDPNRDALACRELAEAFGNESIMNEALESIKGRHAQKFGKIVPIQEGERKAIIHALSTVHGIYSIGRFATWRNILLDDTVHDAAVIKQFIRSSPYDRALKGERE